MPYVIPLTWSPSKDICYSVGKLVFGEAGMHYQSTVAFQYDSQWIETGFAIGADLPLKEGIQYPNGNSLYASPWTGNRSSWFGFMKDHAPGAWLNFLLQKPHLIGLKSIFDEPSPSALDLWLACGHNSQHFSALTLPINPCTDMAFESCGSSKKSLMQVAAFLSDVVDRRFNVLDGALLRLYNLSSNMGGTRPKLLEPIQVKAHIVGWSGFVTDGIPILMTPYPWGLQQVLPNNVELMSLMEFWLLRIYIVSDDMTESLMVTSACVYPQHR